MANSVNLGSSSATALTSRVLSEPESKSALVLGVLGCVLLQTWIGVPQDFLIKQSVLLCTSYNTALVKQSLHSVHHNDLTK
jgi:hypothetical protein